GPSVDQADVEQTLQDTLRELEQGASRIRQKRRRQRRDMHAEREREQLEAADTSTLRLTEYVSTGELANLLDVPVNQVISLLFASGMMVSINQRLDADTILFVAAEYGREVEFITEFGTDDLEIEEDSPEDLEPRAPVVTVMGHVDHGKTSLLDHIRRENVVAGEAGGITQHIGAYHVELPSGKQITFLDTPGHEAFTAMRARGAKVTDVVVLVVAADDSVKPQTLEAINHARAAEVPLVVAINKIDKAEANTARVMQELADQNVLVEQYGGKVQCAMVSALSGDGVPDLLDKVLLEADLLEVTANPNRPAVGTIIESRLDKGRGVVATVLVQNGTLAVGDKFVAGIYSGSVRAMFDERERRIDSVGPSRPALVLGFDGAPEVGDQFVGMVDEREARDIAQRRQQIHREQSLRQRKHITLDEIGRRLALGEFRELNLIVKGDVGGSVEALSDALLKLSTAEVAVNIIHTGVGAITESDINLASASDAVIIGFQVRPIPSARALAEREEIDVRMYSIIYDAIADVRDALEGLLSPERSEKTMGVAEVRETFKVPKIGTVAGCYVLDGVIRRNDRARVIRDGVVIYEGNLGSLRRFKEDVREVQSGYECGMSMESFQDLKVGDQFETYVVVETKRTLEVQQ
ncbi:MAG: translation initiation factor IF-2, partial [Bacteroidetes bacterium]|nr:translation initiation factor IF-2 [Bacteroidota bacterium]